jgi:hypothetical protein
MNVPFLHWQQTESLNRGNEQRSYYFWKSLSNILQLLSLEKTAADNLHALDKKAS